MPAPEATGLTPRIDQYLSRKDTAERLGVHPVTVYRWGKAGIITEYKLPTGRVRYSPDEIDELLEGLALQGQSRG